MLGCVRASKGDGIDLGFTRDRHLELLKSAKADLARRASFEARAKGAGTSG
jgi:hypothetical protein